MPQNLIPKLPVIEPVYQDLREETTQDAWDILHVEMPNLTEKELDDIVYTYAVFESSGPPETYREMVEGGKMARRYWALLKKYPELQRYGYSDCDVYDPTDG